MSASAHTSKVRQGDPCARRSINQPTLARRFTITRLAPEMQQLSQRVRAVQAQLEAGTCSEAGQAPALAAAGTALAAAMHRRPRPPAGIAVVHWPLAGDAASGLL